MEKDGVNRQTNGEDMEPDIGTVVEDFLACLLVGFMSPVKRSVYERKKEKKDKSISRSRRFQL